MDLTQGLPDFTVHDTCILLYIYNYITLLLLLLLYIIIIIIIIIWDSFRENFLCFITL